MLIEYCPDIKVILNDENNKVVKVDVKDLLPFAWKSVQVLVISFSVQRAKGKTSFKRMRFFLWREINLLEICEMCFARKRTIFGCCEMPAGVRRFISFHIAAKTQYITMHSTLVCEALFHILRQQNISLKTNRWRLPNSDRAGR